jgi:outer membrane biosynthesis protein TonB
MFEIDNTLKYIEASQDDVLEIITSINIPLVAAADYPSEPTKAYICSLRKPKKLVAVYIYLHLIQANIGIIYKPTEGSTPEKDYPTMKDSALEFVENMGFLMEDLGFENLSEREKEDLMKSLPLFIKDLSVLKETEEEKEETVSLDEVEEVPLEKEEEIEEILPEAEEVVIAKEPEVQPPAAAKEVEKEEVKIEEPREEQKKEVKKAAPEPASEDIKIDWDDKELKQMLEPIIRFLASI